MEAKPKTAAHDLASLDIIDVSALLRQKKISPVELTRICLEGIDRLNPELNAFITVTPQAAMKQARAAEREVLQGKWKGPLHGIPVALKDLVDTDGIVTTAGSAVFRDRIPGEDAEVVRRLRAAGAVVVGKTNLHEFAFGGSGVISAYGPVRNPWNLERITGGSSSGSAAAVAAGLCYGALGTDTAGSIRLPAALCGVVGLKPTYGLVSQRGVIPLAWSFDHVGPLARSVQDVAVLLQALAGYDERDPYSRKVPVTAYSEDVNQATESLRLGLAREPFFEALDPEVARCMEEALKVLATLTAGAQEVRVPVDADRTVSGSETWRYHQKLQASQELYHPETRKRILKGANISQEAFQAKSRELAQQRASADAIFRDVDLVITPTCPIPAPDLSELTADLDGLRDRELLMLRNTRPFNVLGLPTISVPCGLTRDGLPVGLQISGPAGHEGRVLALARAYEADTEWHTLMPPISR